MMARWPPNSPTAVLVSVAFAQLCLSKVQAIYESHEYLVIDATKTDVTATGQPLNFTAGDTWAITYQINDRATGTYAATLRGFCVTVAGPLAMENQCQLTMYLPSGTLQVSGPVYIPPGQFDQFSLGTNAITGGTGLYVGARGYAVETLATGEAFPAISDGKGGVQRGVAYPTAPGPTDAYINNG
ncbi:hypothetical protein WJX74_008500 [Apatococcus lobatus]|uniref:Uncharacterized protein n=2 Tax=Apatococcus TaxID=904362 RepID=A0AAW1T6V5_9CHLO